MLLLVEEGKNYCKSLFFVWKVIKDEIKLMVEVFRKVYRVLLFCESVEFNKFELCKLFEIFCFRLKEKNWGFGVRFFEYCCIRDDFGWLDFYKCIKCIRCIIVYRWLIEISGRFCFDYSWWG